MYSPISVSSMGLSFKPMQGTWYHSSQVLQPNQITSAKLFTSLIAYLSFTIQSNAAHSRFSLSRPLSLLTCRKKSCSILWCVFVILVLRVLVFDNDSLYLCCLFVTSCMSQAVFFFFLVQV